MKVADILFNAGIMVREKLGRKAVSPAEYNRQYREEMTTTKATLVCVAILIALGVAGIYSLGT